MKYQLLTLSLFVLAVSGCNGQKNSGAYVTHISAASVIDSDASPTEKAEALAKDAEDLVTPSSLPAAMDIVNQALQQDAKNERANLLKVLLTPIIAEKGFFSRTASLYKKSDESTKTYTQITDMIAGSPQTEYFQSFWDSAEADIITEHDLQVETDKLIQYFDDLRIFARDNKDTEISMKATSLLAPDIIKRYADGCSVVAGGPHEYDLVCPAPTVRTQVILNRGDFVELETMAIYYKIVLALLNAYDMTGLTDESKAAMDDLTATPQSIAEALLKNGDFGKLRKEARLGEIKEATLDLLGGIRWATNNQSTLCPKGDGNPQNRIGYFGNTGLCAGSSLQPVLDLYDNFAQGKAIPIEAEKYGSVYKTDQTGMNVAEKPVQDLRTFAPFKIDKCSQIQNTNDPTFGGIFNKGDANTYMTVHDTDCNRP